MEYQNTMKPGIHPQLRRSDTSSAPAATLLLPARPSRSLRTDLCNVCHPFYTGEQRIVDTAGQVERFMKRMEAAASTEGRPSKRQSRLAERQAKLEAERQRQAEIAAQAEAEEAAARAAAVAAAAEVAAVEAAASGEGDAVTEVAVVEDGDVVAVAEAEVEVEETIES